jgi:hypothetical protein
MHTFSLRRRGWWVARAFTGNPLLRRTDRIEAVMVVVAIVVALAVIPVAAALGAAVYGSHVVMYAEQARTHHRVVATVIEASPGTNAPHITTSEARVMWMFGPALHTGWFKTDHTVKTGERVDLWVNDVGDEAAPPTPASHAVIDAIAAGAGIWAALALVLRVLVAMGRLPLNRIRQAQWEREIKSLADGGRTNRPH